MSKTTICVASNNTHKIEELQQMLGAQFDLRTMAEIGCHDEIEEYGTTFQQNSQIKAEYIFQKYALNVIADDSGLEVEYLDNKPGVYSARYAGEPTNHAANIQKLLQELGDATNRNAAFKTVITLILDGNTYFFEGEIKGTITKELKGEGGFGYDPVFVPEGFEKTFAELGSEIKNSVSHRGRAIAKMLDFLQKK
jgi:XTP/dITP diphosphohydrolase